LRQEEVAKEPLNSGSGPKSVEGIADRESVGVRSQRVRNRDFANEPHRLGPEWSPYGSALPVIQTDACQVGSYGRRPPQAPMVPFGILALQRLAP
jgi:hypothetical protein